MLLCLVNFYGVAQNLVPNPGFEEYTECPTDANNGEPLECIPWVQGNASSSDYYNRCNFPLGWGVPDNHIGHQETVSGDGYVGLYARHTDFIGNENSREYIQAQLLEPLVAGVAYQVSFYVSVADNRCRTVPMGALLSVEPPPYNGQLLIEEAPQIEVFAGFLGDYLSWTLISRCFVAEGGEQYITIGNFRTDAESPVDPDCAFELRSYYYVEDVSVIEMPHSEENFALDPVESCGPYEINPGTAENYTWSDGTTNPTLTVSESGTYAVTMSNGCDFSYGTIDVTILLDSPPVELPNDTLLCEGETLDIFLDPNAGDYEWNDQSSDSEIEISAPGTYSVTLTDECDETSDEIIVSFLEAPDPVELGDDVTLCPGEVIEYDFDPSVGAYLWQDASTSASYTISESGTYSVTITNMCGQVEDEIVVSYDGPIDFSIGPDAVDLCAGEELIIELDPALGTFEWHDQSSGSSYLVSSEGMVSVTITNACFSASDAMEVTLIESPVFSLGADVTVCPGQLPLTFDLSGIDHAEDFLWSNDFTGSVYEANSAGIHSVTVSNSCFDIVDEVQITVLKSDPVVTLPADQQLCSGQTLVLNGGGLIGNYQWQDMSTADTFLVTEAGTYALTVTNICGSGSDTVNINYIPALPSPDLGNDMSLCPGETATLYAGVENVSYLWSENSAGTIGTADSLVITSAGTYSLQVSDACSSASDTILVTFNSNPPDVDLPDAMDLCQGDTILIESGISGVAYLWNDNSFAPALTVFDPGMYSLTVSNTCGSDMDSVVVTDAGPPPFVELGSDLSICPGDQVTVTPLAFDVDAWLWHDGSSDNSYLVSSAGVVVITVANECGVVHDSLEVTLLPDIPVFDLGADVEICPGESASFSIAVSDVDILWNDNTTESELTTGNAGIVFATISNACGSFSDTVEVILLPGIPDLDLGANQSLCPGETITLDPGIENVSYLWNGTLTSETFVTTTPGTVILLISNACGSSTDTLEIIADANGPQVDLGEDILACEGEIVLIESGISGVDYVWNDNSTEPNLEVNSSGTYSLQVSNACGMDADTIVVDIHGVIPSPELGPDTTLCDDETLTLSADGENTIEWQDGSQGTSFTVTTPGTYILFETNHCGSGSDTIHVNYQSPPLPFDLGADVELCAGDSVILTAPATNDMLIWQDGSDGETFIATQSQIYSLVVSNDCGSANDEIVVTLDAQVPVVNLGDDQRLCEGETISLQADQEFFSSYLWSTGSTQPAIEITQPDVYAVTVMTDCYAVSDEVVIGVGEECENGIYIPNVFSPNGDGVNDEWVVLMEDASVIGVECNVFDRWGDLIFSTATMPVSWDGTFDERAVMPGVYVYVLQLMYEDAGVRILSGDITVVR